MSIPGVERLSFNSYLYPHPSWTDAARKVSKEYCEIDRELSNHEAEIYAMQLINDNGWADNPKVARREGIITNVYAWANDSYIEEIYVSKCPELSAPKPLPLAVKLAIKPPAPHMPVILRMAEDTAAKQGLRQLELKATKIKKKIENPKVKSNIPPVKVPVKGKGQPVDPQPKIPKQQYIPRTPLD